MPLDAETRILWTVAWEFSPGCAGACNGPDGSHVTSANRRFETEIREKQLGRLVEYHGV